MHKYKYKIQNTIAEIRAGEYSRRPRQPGFCAGARGGQAGKFKQMQLIFVHLGCRRLTHTKAKPFKCSLSLSLPLAHFTKLQKIIQPMQFAR